MNYKQEIATLIASAIDLDTNEIEAMIEVPSDESKGDFALPCFKLARTMRMAPPKIADEISGKLISPSWIGSIISTSGYLNFFIDKNMVIKETLSAITKDYGKSDEGIGKTICIDYSSINIAKPFHIGHLYTTVIGHSLYRIYKNLGYNVVGINHLGDWGTQFGKLIVALKKWGDEDQLVKDGIKAMMEIYVRFHDEAENDPSLEDEARAVSKQIEDGDEEALRLYRLFRDLTLKDVAKVYDMLDVHFDSYAGESFYIDKTDVIVEKLKADGLLKKDDGAMLVDLEEYKMPPYLILRSDGVTLYATRDIAAAYYRANEYNFEKTLYVVAYQQDLHFRQFFKVAELMGYPWAKGLVHVSYGMVSLVDGAMSTRKGNVVYLEDLLNKAVEKATDIIDEKNPDLADKKEIASQVGIGAVVFQTLKNNRIKDMVFSWENALNFEGETGPYVQYTHARCASLLGKTQVSPVGVAQINCDYLNDDDAGNVIKILSTFKDAIGDACRRNEPYIITRYLIKLAQAFNKYYFEHQIIDEDEVATANRLRLVEGVRITLKNGLYLIGVKSPDRM